MLTCQTCRRKRRKRRRWPKYVLLSGAHIHTYRPRWGPWGRCAAPPRRPRHRWADRADTIDQYQRPGRPSSRVYCFAAGGRTCRWAIPTLCLGIISIQVGDDGESGARVTQNSGWGWWVFIVPPPPGDLIWESVEPGGSLTMKFVSFFSSSFWL